MTIEKLRALLWEQQAEIDRLTERLGRYEDANGDRVRRDRTPAGDPLTYQPEQELLADLGRYGFRDIRVSGSWSASRLLQV
jgi:hypothetical protein